MKLLDEPCKCGWKYEGFHICVDLTQPEPVRKVKVRKPRARLAHQAAKSSPEWRAKLSAAALRHQAEIRERNKSRDEDIIRLYSDEYMTIREVAAVIGINYATVTGVLSRAQEAGLVVIRPAQRRKKVRT